MTNEEYLESIKKSNKDAADKKNLALIQQANDERSQVLNSATQQKEKLDQQYGKAIEDTKTGAQEQYDANAVQELVAQKNVAERMANLGLTDSGLSRNQTTQIAVARGNADAAVRSNLQKAVDALTQELTTLKADINNETANYIRTSQRSLNADIAANNDAADQDTQSQYQEYLTAQAEAEQEQTAAAQKEAQDIIDTLVSIGVRPDESIIAASGRSGAWVDAKLQEYTVNRQKEQDKVVVSSSGGGGGKDDEEDLTYFRKRLEAKFDNGQSEDAVPYLLQSGLSAEDQETLAREFVIYDEWREMYKAANVDFPVFNNYADARAYLHNNGSDNATVLRMLPDEQWNKEKSSGNTSPEYWWFDTYGEYLTAYVAYAFAEDRGSATFGEWLKNQITTPTDHTTTSSPEATNRTTTTTSTNSTTPTGSS